MVSIMAATRGLSLPPTKFAFTFENSKFPPYLLDHRRKNCQFVSFGTQKGDIPEETNKINVSPTEDSVFTDIEERLSGATSDFFEKEETAQMMKKLGSAMDRVKNAQLALEAFRKNKLDAIEVDKVKPLNSDVWPGWVVAWLASFVNMI